MYKTFFLKNRHTYILEGVKDTYSLVVPQQQPHKIMFRVNVIDVFLRMTGCTGPGRMLRLTYFEYAYTLLLFVSTCLSVTNWPHRSSITTDGFSMQLHGVLCLLIESFCLLCIPLRLYHRAHFREMGRYAKITGIPDEYRSLIKTITRFYVVSANLFVVGSTLYAVSFESVRIGDPFTYPFMDVLPGTATNISMYLCKYVVYSLVVYIGHIEMCFLTTTFIYSVGVVKRRIEMIAEQVEMALIYGDEQRLKNAIKHHQDVLK